MLLSLAQILHVGIHREPPNKTCQATEEDTIGVDATYVGTRYEKRKSEAVKLLSW